MEPYSLYIEQSSFDGVSYAYGTLLDTYTQWGILCAESPYRPAGDPKDVATRDWLDEHGLDVYIPQDTMLKHFDIEYTFLCVGSEADVKASVMDFYQFLCGKASTINQKSIASVGSRLILFDEYTGRGWKDVRLKSFSQDAFVMDNSDDEIKLRFKVVFTVYDPVTPISVGKINNNTRLMIGRW